MGCHTSAYRGGAAACVNVPVATLPSHPDEWSLRRYISHERRYTPTSVVFFVSFILLNPVILINVVVAVLLEKMVSDEDDEEESGDDDDDDDDATAGVASADDGGAEHHADGGGGDAPHAPTPSKPPSHGSSRQAKDGKGEFEVAARLQASRRRVLSLSCPASRACPACRGRSVQRVPRLQPRHALN